MISKKSENKSALITGGAKRIGQVFGFALAGQGYNIALHYSRSRSDAEETAKEIRELGVRCEIYQCDFADMQSVEKLIPRVFQDFPGCNVLVNSASIFIRGEFLKTDIQFLDDHLTVNFKAPYLLSQMFAKFCKSGLIVNMLDTKITRTSKQFFAYTISKKCLYEFTRMAAKVLGPSIRVNGICPGIILPSTETSIESLDKLARALPLARKGDPQNLVKALLYLIENEFVTGECLFVDGGEQL